MKNINRGKRYERAGSQIHTLQDLMVAAKQKRSVYCPARMGLFSRRLPAAFVINLAASVVLGGLRSGMYIWLRESEMSGLSVPEPANDKAGLIPETSSYSSHGTSGGLVPF